ncbi:MAG: hypothetical protein ACE1ZD_04890 [Dehalococcoidia bacterium]
MTLIAPTCAKINFLPFHGQVGLMLIGVAWPTSWLQLQPLAEYSFFPLWLGYILIVDALVLRRERTSLLARNPKAFLGMFLASMPLWWAFEGLNHFTQNWQYLGASEYSALRYFLVASWHFSIVIPAIFETAELIGSFGFFNRFLFGPALPSSRALPAGAMVLGLAMLASIVLWPDYAFAGAWLCLLLLLDPINCLRGRPSILAWLQRGDWRVVMALGTGALVCGWFWEMWNYWAFPKWEYTIPLVDFAHVFEMPLLGYVGYVPFGLEVYAGYHFLAGLFERVPKVSLGVARTNLPLVGPGR